MEIISVENIFICWNRNFALVSANFSIQLDKGIDRDESPLKVDTPAEREAKQPENNDESKQWMERIFKRHKKLKIDFYLYDSFFFCLLDWATTAARRRESHEIHFHFETAKQMFIIAGKYHSASGATTTQKSFS